MPERSTAGPAVTWETLASAAIASAADCYRRVGEIGARYASELVEAAGRGQGMRSGARHLASELVALPGLAWSRLGAALDPVLARAEEPGASAPVDGREVLFPLRVLDASQGLAVYAVPIAPAQALLDARHHGDLVAADIGGARAALEIFVVDYRIADLGAYRELGVGLYATPRTRPWQLGLTVLHEPVTGRFACRAGVEIWGDPKTEERLEFGLRDTMLDCTLVRTEGQVLVLSFTVPRGGTGASTDVPLTLYTRLEGRLHASRLVRTGRGERVRAGGAGVTLELKDVTDPLSQALGTLGLPGITPIFHSWTEHMSARVSRPVAIG
jgi:hypothetical protein